MDRKIFFSDGGIHISNRRVIASGKIFLLQDILSVKLGIARPKRGLSIFSILIGLALLLDEGGLFVIGGFSIFLGIVAWMSARTKFVVSLHTASGEHRALSSSDRVYIEKVIHALDAALVNRIDPRQRDLLTAREIYPGRTHHLSSLNQLTTK